MANLTESPIYEPGIFQLEKSTPPLGGAPVIDNGVPSAGHANAQGLQLANRTAWLNANKLAVSDTTTTPTADKIPRADSLGQVDSEWISQINGESRVNLLPAEMTVFSSTPPDITTNGGATKTTIADSGAFKGYSLQTTWTTATGQALLLAKDFTLASCNMMYKQQKYIVSFRAKASVSGHQVGTYLRAYRADGTSTVNSSTPLITLTDSYARYSAILDLSGVTFDGNRMSLVILQNSSGVAGRTVWFDSIMVEAVPDNTNDPSNFVIGSSFSQVVSNSNSVKNTFIASATPVIPESFLQTNSLTQPSVKLVNDGSGNWTIMQGFTWVPETEKIYTAWDGLVSDVATVVIMRHGSNGTYELKSAGVSNLINHGQDLGHAYYNGVLYLVSSNPNAPGITVFTPPTVDGGAIGNVRQFNLLTGTGWGLMTVNESIDSRFIVTLARDNNQVEPYFAHVFDFQSLMEGADGDRFNEYIASINVQPKDEYSADTRFVVQSVTCDSANVYVLNSADQTTDLKYLSAFDMVTGKRHYRKQLSVGLAKATARGTICEYEGMAWMPSNADGGKSLWIGIRMRNSAGASNEMFLMPIHESGYGSLGVKAPGPSALQVAKGRSITHPLGSDLRFVLVDETGTTLATTSVTGGTGGESGGASRQRWLFPESGYFGTTASLSPTGSNTTGVNIFGTLGRGVFSSTGATTLQLQRQDATGSVMEFFASTTKVGGITVTATATAYATSSDQTLKNDEGELSLEDSYKVIENILWHSFNWKIDGQKDSGVFAQELYKVYPPAVVVGAGQQVVTDPDGNEHQTYDAWSVDYSKLIIPMGRAMQGLLSEINSLKSTLALMEDRLTKLESK